MLRIDWARRLPVKLRPTIRKVGADCLARCRESRRQLSSSASVSAETKLHVFGRSGNACLRGLLPLSLVRTNLIRGVLFRVARRPLRRPVHLISRSRDLSGRFPTRCRHSTEWALRLQCSDCGRSTSTVELTVSAMIRSLRRPAGCHASGRSVGCC